MKLPVVYVYKRTSDKGRELRYSLRSLANLKDWNGQAFIVGDREDWFSNQITVIEAPKSADKYVDRNLKLQAAINHKSIADDFIYMNDDFYVLEKTSVTPLYDGQLETDSSRNNQWMKTKANTKSYLESQGIMEPKNYDIHAPMVFNKNLLSEVLIICDNHPDMQIRSLYGNLNQIGGKQYADQKTSSTKLPKAKFVSSRIFCPELETLFPEKSEFEK